MKQPLSYNLNAWEAPVPVTDSNYTCHLQVAGKMTGTLMKVVARGMKKARNEIRPEAWVTAHPNPFESKEIVLAPWRKRLANEIV